MSDTETKLQNYLGVFRRLFGGQPAQIALLDFAGVILATNDAWKQFGNENGMSRSYNCIGKNYLSLCEPAAEDDCPLAQQAYLGLLEVIHTQRPKFTMIYPCHSPQLRRWYRMWVEPQTPDAPVIVVAHYLCATKPPIGRFQTDELSTDWPLNSGFEAQRLRIGDWLHPDTIHFR